MCTHSDAPRLQVRKYDRQRRVPVRYRDRRRIERAAREGLEPAEHVGLVEPVGGEGDEGDLPTGLHCIRRDHPGGYRTLSAVALTAGGYEQPDDDGRPGGPCHGGGPPRPPPAPAVGANRRTKTPPRAVPGAPRGA